MPRGEKTGPAGTGPMTGRAAGYCAEDTTPGLVSVARGRGVGGRGYGGGRGQGRRRRNRLRGTDLLGEQPAVTEGPDSGIAPPIDQGEELDALKQQAETLCRTLDGIRERIAELEHQAKEAAAASSDA